jgi:hypothetical protein
VISSFVAILLGVLAAPPIAAAQASEAAEAEDAAVSVDVLLAEAREATAADDLARARRLLVRALSYEPSAAIAFNLALIERSLGHPLSAREQVEGILAGEYGDVPADRRAHAESLLSDLAGEIATLLVTVTGAESAEVRLDGRRAGSSPASGALRVPTDPGRHLISVVAQGHAQEEREVSVEPGGVASVRFTFGADRSAGDPDPDPDPVLATSSEPDFDDRGGSVLASPWLWVGIAAVVVGAVVLGVLLSVSGQTMGTPDGYLGSVATLRSGGF